jgi:metal-responsive CopG/Arc/MetJ family transcriptional regulator
MKTIQITIDEDLLDRVDLATQHQNVARSQFIRRALQDALHRQAIVELERKQAEGYRLHPILSEEFDIWVAEQAWGE